MMMANERQPIVFYSCIRYGEIDKFCKVKTVSATCCGHLTTLASDFDSQLGVLLVFCNNHMPTTQRSNQIKSNQMWIYIAHCQTISNALMELWKFLL